MITATSEYALRALLKLAQIPSGGLISGKDMSKELDIPANYLSKVMLTLRNAGIVDTTRGPGGGYRLLKPAAKIPLVDVVELFEGISTRPRCFLGEKNMCSDEDPCAAHIHFRSVRAAYIRYLEKTTIGALVKSAPSTVKRKPKKKTTR